MVYVRGLQTHRKINQGTLVICKYFWKVVVYIFKDKFFITSGKCLFFIDWKNINFLFCVFFCHNHNVQYYGENMGSDIFLYIYHEMFNKMKFISHMI